MGKHLVLLCGALLLLAQLILTTGCVSAGGVINVIEPEVTTPIIVAQKIPMRVGIVIQDETYTDIVTTNAKKSYASKTPISVPFGKILKRKTIDVLSSYFDEAVLIQNQTNAHGVDAFIATSITDTQLDEIDTTGFGFFTSTRVDASVKLRAAMSSPDGKTIWSKTIQSPKTIGKEIRVIDRNQHQSTAVSGTISDAVASALKDAVMDMSVSQEVRNYRASKTESDRQIAQQAMPTEHTKHPAKNFTSDLTTGIPFSKPVLEAAVTVKSDIDSLPEITTKPNKNTYAIVIGIEQYRQKLPKADFAVSDAKLVSEYLSKVMGYPEENVVTITNEQASLGDFVKYFEKWLPNNAEQGSTILVYYSGHGSPSPKSGDAYLVPYDGDPAFIEQTGYSLKRVYENLAKLPARNIIVVLDSCFSGAGGKSVSAKGSRALVRVEKASALNIAVLTASLDNQISSSYEDKGHGVFTYFFLKGIKELLGEDKNSKLELSELYNYIKPQVERTSRRLYNNEQTPQLITADEQMNNIGLR